jgi:hypothetical protein
MRRFLVVCGAMTVALVLSVAWLTRGSVAAQEKPAQLVQRWEYKQVNVLPAGVSQMEARLNAMGSERWELCATVVPLGRGTDEFAVSFIFKRPRR